VGIPERKSLEDLDVNGRVKLKQTWNTQDRRVKTGVIWLTTGPSGGT
jgi:hypothetical protein